LGEYVNRGYEFVRGIYQSNPAPFDAIGGAAARALEGAAVTAGTAFVAGTLAFE